jgi:hypothetical protein
MANCSSLGLRSRNRALPSTWSSGEDHPARGWRTFLHNHAADIAAMDLFVVPTIGFDLRYAFVIIRLRPQRALDLTATPTTEWIARKITEAFPWEETPRHLICDRDLRARGSVFGTHRGRRDELPESPPAFCSPRSFAHAADEFQNRPLAFAPQSADKRAKPVEGNCPQKQQLRVKTENIGEFLGLQPRHLGACLNSYN